MLEKITPLILTFNEAPNIERTLQKLFWARKIIVIDSYSTDDTLEILQTYSQVEVFKRRFDTHANQWNYGLKKITTEWVMSLDADYVLTDELIAEISTLPQNQTIDGYFIAFKYCVFGKALSGTILPPRQALFCRDKASYIDDGHTQLLKLNGNSSSLKNCILHDDRKPLSRWLWAQDRYMVIEAKKLVETSVKELSWGDKIRQKVIFAPFILFVYCLIFKKGILNGWIGWYYAFQRAFAETLLSLRLIEIYANHNKDCLTTRKAQN